MNIEEYIGAGGEKPLDNIVFDGGFARVFRTIGCVGDSLSSGEYESSDGNGNQGYHDYYEYSWGQFMARNAGINVYNFSRGGMTAKWFMDSFGDSCGIWTDEKKCQAYIIALGVNDLKSIALGSVDDIDREDYKNNKPTFAGYYAQIISRLKTVQPDAKFFLLTMPKGDRKEVEPHAALLCDMAKIFENTYGPVKRKREERRQYNYDNSVSRENKGRTKAASAAAKYDGTEYVLVDGYNVIFSWDELKKAAQTNLDAARNTLINILCNYQGYRKCELILVFDAYKVKGNVREVERVGNISIVYTKEAETADMYIEKVSNTLAKKHRVRVVTSDGMEQLIILGNGALRVSSKAFLDEVRLAEKEIRSIISDMT